MKFFKRAGLVTILALFPTVVLGVVLSWLTITVLKKPMTTILCGPGQDLDVRSRGELFCVSPTDDVGVDVTLRVLGPLYAVSWVALYLVVYFLARYERKLEEQEEALPAKPAVVGNFAGSAPRPPPINTSWPADPVTSTMPVNKEPTRYLLCPNPELAQVREGTRLLQSARQSGWQPSLALDVGADAIRVMDLSTNAVTASASPAQVTATPETYKYSLMGSWRSPVLVVDVPGWQALTITCLDRADPKEVTPSRFSWRGEVPERDKPADFMVRGADWLTLVEKCGLAAYLQDQLRI